MGRAQLEETLEHLLAVAGVKANMQNGYSLADALKARMAACTMLC